VSVSEYNSRRVLVSGEVARPGPVALRSGRTTLLEVLLEAGGLTQDAGDTALVTRARPPGGATTWQSAPRTLRVNLKRLIEQPSATDNIWVEAGDVIYVPLREERHFYVLGYVTAPGAYPLPGGGIGMLEAIACARGLRASGNPRKVFLIRNVGGKDERYRLDLTRLAAAQEPDVTLLPGDRIVVSTSFGRRIIDGLLYSTGLRALMPVGY